MRRLTAVVKPLFAAGCGTTRTPITTTSEERMATTPRDTSGLPHLIPADHRNAEGLVNIVLQHPNIRFISLFGIDLAGNETDERIPAPRSAKEATALLEGGVQTDGSSVALPEIATLHNAKVDLVADLNGRWYIDYNEENVDGETGLPVGVIMIPAFLRHEHKWVDSRSVLRRAEEYVAGRVKTLLTEHPGTAERLGVQAGDIESVVLTAATELEFWVRTPDSRAEVDRLAVSQALQEQYWKPTKGDVRTGLERSLETMRRYGLEPEMGHKEVGGVDARVRGSGGADVMEQIEIDWRFSTPLQAADNELLVRTLVARTYAALGLEVTFQAKPIEGIAGNGEHTHIGMAIRLRDGSIRNIFAPARMDEDFLSEIGYGAVMGLLKHWEAVGPFVTCSTDAFNRLKPGFEAPVCAVTSLGHSVDLPSRNRSVLAGLVRDMDSPMATRFEVRAPNPHTNSYLAIAGIYMAMLDGVEHALVNGRSAQELAGELSKSVGDPASYLLAERSYRSEHDVFEHFTQEERDALFGKPPATVVETLGNLKRYPDLDALLCAGGVFTPAIIGSYSAAMLAKWRLELGQRIIPAYVEIVRSSRRLPGGESDPYDARLWDQIQELRSTLMKDTDAAPSLFTQVRQAIAGGEDSAAAALQIEMARRIVELQAQYGAYTGNLLDLAPEDINGAADRYRLLPASGAGAV
ncbi:MAG: glutamine synthetase [Chloroflexi bacterium]|nr:glutamine synthetase [Chloroflexota bacterium]